jgi:hypothetical protein
MAAGPGDHTNVRKRLAVDAGYVLDRYHTGNDWRWTPDMFSTDIIFRRP